MKDKERLIVEWTDILNMLFVLSMLVFISQLIIVGMGNSWIDAFYYLKYAIPALFVLSGNFLIHYYFLIPRYSLYRNSIGKYLIGSIIVYILLSIGNYVLGIFIYSDVSFTGLPNMAAEINLAFQLLFFLLNLLLIITAFSIRYRQRNRHLELQQIEQEKERAQNELQRLKGQLNPHFLFNTLNNISSLSAFDPDATQESISRLSEMLRYVLYDSSDEKVLLKKDVEFMQNYMNLMQIRYEDTLKPEVSMTVNDPNLKISPMLFISLLENAYKYGASSLHPCKLIVQLEDDDKGDVHFCIKNTLLTEQEMASKKKGGLGLVNLKKRLDLLYPDKYTFTYGENEDNFYQAEVFISCN